MLGRSKSYNEQMKEEMERKGYQTPNYVQEYPGPVDSKPDHEYVYDWPDGRTEVVYSRRISTRWLIVSTFLMALGIALPIIWFIYELSNTIELPVPLFVGIFLTGAVLFAHGINMRRVVNQNEKDRYDVHRTFETEDNREYTYTRPDGVEITCSIKLSHMWMKIGASLIVLPISVVIISAIIGIDVTILSGMTAFSMMMIFVGIFFIINGFQIKNYVIEAKKKERGEKE